MSCFQRGDSIANCKVPIKQQEENLTQDLNTGWAGEVSGQKEQTGKIWYLPHHAVYKTVDSEVKCVLAFDGSAKQCGVLLNKCLEMGLNLQADVVRLRVEERDACRFLWSNCSQYTPARVYRLTQECDEGIQRTLSNMHADDLLMRYNEKSEMAELIRRGRCEFITSSAIGRKSLIVQTRVQTFPARREPTESERTASAVNTGTRVQAPDSPITPSPNGETVNKKPTHKTAAYRCQSNPVSDLKHAVDHQGQKHGKEECLVDEDTLEQEDS
ncbi:hypothetical protein T05_2544 [Trichinella murrelli]|uniref:Uncharacterized protein n=1 Tax=Trichinella murrelli TaxID=144512 RepID=A0A0V0T9R1_9BILA|nr:hypothetical protein T05_2544 [Trichinella murrelli]